jgi:hypothetical protein
MIRAIAPNSPPPTDPLIRGRTENTIRNIEALGTDVPKRGISAVVLAARPMTILAGTGAAYALAGT